MGVLHLYLNLKKNKYVAASQPMMPELDLLQFAISKSGIIVSKSCAKKSKLRQRNVRKL